MWYYCTLTIRESILKVNGSRIKGWWRLHHFLSTVAAGILLIWPDTEAWALFRNQFIWFNGYISTHMLGLKRAFSKCNFAGVVQYLQFRYQRGQLYRLKALGERYNMDITIEGFHSWMWRGLSFLLPFLFGGYFFQLYNSYKLYQLSFLPSATWHVSACALEVGMRFDCWLLQVPVLSLMFLVLFVGNISTTIIVIPSKLKDKVRLRYSLTSQRISFGKNLNLLAVRTSNLPLSRFVSLLTLYVVSECRQATEFVKIRISRRTPVIYCIYI